MNPKLELLIFDWDGTLIDSAGEIVAAMTSATAELGLPPRDPVQMRRMIGLGLVEAFQGLFPELGGDDLRAVIDSYRRLYGTTPRVYGSPFPGVEPMLDAFAGAGTPLAVATGKSRRGLDRALEHTGWGHRFAYSRCADETASKPDPRMLDELLLHSATESTAALMVGDTTYDMEMACRAGVPAVAVAWGVHETEELLEAGAMVVLDTLEQLPEFVAGL